MRYRWGKPNNEPNNNAVNPRENLPFRDVLKNNNQSMVILGIVYHWVCHSTQYLMSIIDPPTYVCHYGYVCRFVSVFHCAIYIYLAISIYHGCVFVSPVLIFIFQCPYDNHITLISLPFHSTTAHIIRHAACPYYFQPIYLQYLGNNMFDLGHMYIYIYAYT